MAVLEALSPICPMGREARNEHSLSHARLIDPANGLDELGTLVVEKGKISAIGKNAKVPEKMKSHDCNGMAILPGLVDMQVFTGEPGEEYRETLATACRRRRRVA